jgi:hypothetical protein
MHLKVNIIYLSRKKVTVYNITNIDLIFQDGVTTASLEVEEVQGDLIQVQL